MESHNRKTIAKYYPLFFAATHIIIVHNISRVHVCNIPERTNTCGAGFKCARKTKSSEIINPK